jgi:hypothetical protein
VEVRCPLDCAYLASAREHPPAAVIRQRQKDVGLLAHLVRDLTEAQSQLLFMVTTYLQRYEPADLQPLQDEDVAEAVAALAETAETASRGLIYEHRPASFPADRLATTLRPLLAEARKEGGGTFERDAAVVLRRIEEAARGVRRLDPSNRRAFIDLLGRVIRTGGDQPPDGGTGDPDPPRLIIP